MEARRSSSSQWLHGEHEPWRYGITCLWFSKHILQWMLFILKTPKSVLQIAHIPYPYTVAYIISHSQACVILLCTFSYSGTQWVYFSFILQHTPTCFHKDFLLFFIYFPPSIFVHSTLLYISIRISPDSHSGSCLIFIWIFLAGNKSHS